MTAHRKITLGIVDYDVGNHASIRRVLHMLGYRCRISKDPDTLSASDMIILPGVGAFPEAMASLREYGLNEFLQTTATSGKPILGVCLGMQLLATSSEEHGMTDGLNLIPGHVLPMGEGRWHIGWNSIEMTGNDPLLIKSDGEIMYFNHSFHFSCDDAFRSATTTHDEVYTSIVRRENVVGIQFHPEKSHVPGHALLKSIIEGFHSA